MDTFDDTEWGTIATNSKSVSQRRSLLGIVPRTCLACSLGPPFAQTLFDYRSAGVRQICNDVQTDKKQAGLGGGGGCEGGLVWVTWWQQAARSKVKASWSAQLHRKCQQGSRFSLIWT
jgi:hypothetical protein